MALGAIVIHHPRRVRPGPHPLVARASAALTRRSTWLPRRTGGRSRPSPITGVWLDTQMGQAVALSEDVQQRFLEG